jgi:hypothetical protein
VNTISTLTDIIADCVIIAAALYALWRALRYIQGVVDDRREHLAAEHDPVSVGVWDVLADARRITEEGASGAAG